jgi:hypothetical protein
MTKIRLVTAATAAAIALATSAGCASSTTGAPAGSGTCSNPNPDPAALTFAGVVCVQRVSSVRQRDGSSLLQLHVSVTNRDPNTFDVSSVDFSVQDAHGASIPAGGGASHCIQQSLADSGWPVDPGKTFTAPGQLCYSIPPGDRAVALVWQDDVTVRLP